MGKPVELSNGRVWPTKTAAKEHFKSMLGRYADNDIIDADDDHDDLSALLERFDVLVADGAPKIGVGIERFERRLNRGDGWSSPGFWVIRTDGTSTDFSYVKAVDGNAKSQSQEFYDACHNAVSRDLLKLKQKQFDHFSNGDGEIECDLTGELVSFPNASLSHATPSFGTIVDAFRRLKGWEGGPPPGTLTSSEDEQLSTHFTDDAVSREFRDYHHKVAVLRIIAKHRPPGSVSRSAAVRRPLRLT